MASLFSPHVCFSLQSALEWALFLLRLGTEGPGLARGGHTRGPEGEQHIRGWGPEDREHSYSRDLLVSFVNALTAVVVFSLSSGLGI